MPLIRQKTWSREVLAIERRLAGEIESGLLTYEKRACCCWQPRPPWRQGSATGWRRWPTCRMATGFDQRNMCCSERRFDRNGIADRLLGTLIGAAFGAGFSLAPASVSVILVYLVAVILAMVTCSLLGLKSSARLSGVTVTIILLVHRAKPGEGSNWALPTHRVLEVLLGLWWRSGFRRWCCQPRKSETAGWAGAGVSPAGRCSPP